MTEITKERRDAIMAGVDAGMKTAAALKSREMTHKFSDDYFAMAVSQDAANAALDAAEAQMGAELASGPLGFVNPDNIDDPTFTVRGKQAGVYSMPIYAAPPAVEPMKVKPLEWGRDYVDRMWYGNTPARQTGPSYLVGDNGLWCINGTGRWVHDQAGDVEAAKAAAQADYEARIHSALTTSPEPSHE